MHITSLFLAYVSLAVAILISTVMVALIKDNKDRLRDTQGSGKVRTVHVRIGSRVKFEDNDSANMSLKGRCGRLVSSEEVIRTTGVRHPKAKVQPASTRLRVKPNEPCHCGSRKKFKKCCRDTSVHSAPPPFDPALTFIEVRSVLHVEKMRERETEQRATQL